MIVITFKNINYALSDLCTSDYGAVGLLDCQSNGLSDFWVVGVMGCRTSGLSDFWVLGIIIVGLMGRQIYGMSDL